MRSVPSEVPANANAPQTAQSAIGQFDVRATPLQMAMVAAADREPRRPDEAVPRAGGPRARPLGAQHHPSQAELGTAVSPQTAATLAQMMVAVVEQRHRHQRADRRGPGGGQDRHRPAGQQPQAARMVRVLRTVGQRRPRSPSRSSSRTAATQAEVSGNQLAAPIARAVMKAVLGR